MRTASKGLAGLRLFDPHAHMCSRAADDYQAMAARGVAVVLEPSYWPGRGSFAEHYAALVSREPSRAGRFGVRHFCALGLSPREANDEALAEGALAALPAFLEKESVLAVGEIGFDGITPAEEKALAAQLELARRAGLPAIVHTPDRDKKRATLRCLAMIRESGLPEERVLLEHNTEETLPLVLDTGCWAGHSRFDEAKMLALIKEHGSARILVNSAADGGDGDPLKVAKAASHFLEAGLPLDQVRQVVWDNPVAFFSQSGRLDLSSVSEGRPCA